MPEKAIMTELLHHAEDTSVQNTTALGIGVVSKNTVDAAIRVAELLAEPLFLICSRRQIDSASVGGGYVNHWTTETFSEYLLDRRPANLLMARDHGGPYQGKQRSFPEATAAMEDAARSFHVDIRAGFDFLHFDTCLNADGFADDELALNRYIDLLSDAKAFAKSERREFAHEIGTEDQIDSIATTEATAESVQRLLRASDKSNLPLPEYMVVQTGTKVMATDNVGATAKITTYLSTQANLLSSISSFLRKHNIKIKCHNGDYVQHSTLRMLNQSGVGGLNVAPEFGTTETKALLSLLKRYEMNDELTEFVRIAVESNTWRKWVSPEKAYSDIQLATICGHYCFVNDDVIRIKQAVSGVMLRRNAGDIDDTLRAEIERNILFYTNGLGYSYRVAKKKVA